MCNESEISTEQQRKIELRFREGEIALLTAFLSNLQNYETVGEILDKIKLISTETYINLPRQFGFMSNERLEVDFSQNGRIDEFKSSVTVYLKARISFHGQLTGLINDLSE